MTGQRALPVILGGPQGVPKPSTRVDRVCILAEVYFKRLTLKINQFPSPLSPSSAQHQLTQIFRRVIDE